MTEMVQKMVRPDSKGRITLGQLTQGISRFAVEKDDQNRIILTPYIEIAATEQWLFNNQKALEKVKDGLKDSAEGRVSGLGSFAKYFNEDAG